MPKRKVKTKRLDSGIDFEEEAVCERKVLQGSQDWGGGSRLGRKEVQDRMTKREWQKASRPPIARSLLFPDPTEIPTTWAYPTLQ